MNFFLMAAVASLISFLATPLVIKFAKRFKIVDDPRRQHPAILHKKPLPRAGGIGIFVAIWLTYILASLLTPGILTKSIIGIFLGSIIIIIVGVLDDKYDLNPYVRLLSNFIAASIIVSSGIGITSVVNPLGGRIYLDEIVFKFDLPAFLPFNFLAGPHSIFLLADFFALVWIVWLMNALNWSSGVDGQLAGIVVIAALALGLVASKFIPTDPKQIVVALLAFVLAGSFIGFLPWSFYPQKIMPGYGGATLAGFILGVLAIMAGAKLATVLIVLAAPIVDGVWAVLRRLLRKRSPFWGDKEHLHHQLVALGWSKPQVVLFYYAVSASLAIVALNLDSQGKFFALAVLASVIMAFLITLSITLKRVSNELQNK